jgi:hypothetical protein
LRGGGQGGTGLTACRGFAARAVSLRLAGSGAARHTRMGMRIRGPAEPAIIDAGCCEHTHFSADAWAEYLPLISTTKDHLANMRAFLLRCVERGVTMSDKHEPTLADVLDAVTGLRLKQEEFGRKQEEYGLKQEEYGRKQDEYGRKQDEYGRKQEEMGLKQDGLRVSLMDRMDRLQDSLTEQRDDISVMLELLATNQRIAERGLSEARTSFDLHGRTASALTTMQRQLRDLRDEVNELRNRQ